MKIGMNMHLWSTNVSEEHFADIEKLKDIGYDGIEIFLAEPDRANYENVGSFLKSIDLEVNGCLGLGPDQDPISTDASIRQAGLDKIKEAIDNMHAAGGRNICGPFHSAFATFSRDEPQEDEYKRSAEVLHAAAEHAAQAGITLTPEALNRFECYLVNTMAQLKKLVDLADHPNLRGMFDPHHANIEEKSFAGAIDTIGPVMTHVHISENDRGTPGAGHIPWDEVFSSIAKTGYDGWYTIEAFSRDDLGFANAINVWREFNPRMDICRDGYAFTKAMIEKHKI
ncbi:MAG: sugar phosphate isomerase/epimerase [Akkermansiaceae bacterium]|nr:sugar phosphate isomerase/epimerase [Akkermansiaceae bacterium]